VVRWLHRVANRSPSGVEVPNPGNYVHFYDHSITPKHKNHPIMIDNRLPSKAYVLGGSLLNVLVTFDFNHLLSSILLAIMDTVVSYFVSKELKAVFE
jgi:hypothetical protein